MKEENKKKLKRFCKVSAYVGGLFAMLLLGMGLGNCSAKDKPVKANAETGLVLADHKQALNPKRALDPYAWHTLSTDSDNLLLDAQAGHFDFSSFYEESTLTGYKIASNSLRDMYLLGLSAGSYVLDCDSMGNQGWLGKGLFLNSYGANQVQKAFNGEPLQRVFIESADAGDDFFISSDDPSRRVFNVVDPFIFFLVSVNNNDAVSTPSLTLGLYDPLKTPATKVISFPDDYNPLSGFGIPNDGLVGQLSGGRTSPFRLDLYFRSGGRLFNRIDFYFLPMQGVEYVSALNTSGSPSVFSGSGFVYCSLIEYISVDGASFTAWRAIFGTKSDGNIYLRNFGEWTSKQYQTIEVIYYDPVLGQSGVAPNLDQVGILELRTASGVPTPIIGGDSNADVFSLLGVGFQSVAGLLNIQILPFLTLGTLLFVPLVVIIIFAILKVLNK